MKAIVNVGLKQGVLDDQGKATHHALDTLGFKDIVKNVRIGKQIIIELNSSNKQDAEVEVKKMCEKLLANTVIEDYNIEIVG
ncbi:MULTISPECIES: phosphoribosylformylglycinamidine synthase subunit PurS [Arcobacteraceae]|jgi:phosphoribosylformylglycinamidine synthase|uniref:Phosphoribosylformylglycinamidine synthase subunit PurS n=1 Tax=Arcobacter lacus TaxID=1912876 RepID=A0ABX5JGB9_9BACT|nr:MULTISPECIES: phosphoribosylformylglycinamidine synthase subunit PurS [Arcobacteraceae]MCT7554753.1 phosphoribosylformylglycinamidine synthase subunit PurS [Aliarcobacter butzleri]MCT7588896.1 phosphoribosylformylglycinamidine synthase subunit PurS [Aliarcobacter butzleri]MCT7909312.1 phosphoribosylformylglycinamidine synthase subunit PurS [Arcobacter lacus]MCT7911063.1 phosphoribosylformylglycinamidine synthase subunit PurS [Arcobacter lacus]PUE65271.1 phosphoribosylformylglycinamidine syn